MLTFQLRLGIVVTKVNYITDMSKALMAKHVNFENNIMRKRDSQYSQVPS